MTLWDRVGGVVLFCYLWLLALGWLSAVYLLIGTGSWVLPLVLVLPTLWFGALNKAWEADGFARWNRAYLHRQREVGPTPRA